MTPLDLDHPIKHLRTVAGLSQVQLEKRLSVSEQYVRRVEHGLIGEATNLNELFTVLHDIIERRHKEEQRSDFLTAMSQLVTKYVDAASDLESSTRLRCEAQINFNRLANWGSDHHERMRNDGLVACHEFVQDWYYLKRLALAPIELHMFEFPSFISFMSYIMHKADPGGQPSLYRFCQVFGLHIYTIQLFERQHRRHSRPFDGAIAANWPVDLRKALAVAGVEWDKIKFLGSELHAEPRER